MKVLSNIIQGLCMTALIAVVLLLMLPFVPYDFGLELRIVESGSMEPAIPTGALVAIYPANEYGVHDVITFESQFADVPTTHRITDVYQEAGRTWFVTKGDANEEADSAAVPLGDVLGKVWLSVPYVGFVLDFARQPLGFALLIVLPAVAIILGELEKIWLEVRGRRRTERAEEAVVIPGRFRPRSIASSSETPPAPAQSRHMMDIHTPVRYRLLPTLDLRAVTPRPASGGALSPARHWLGVMYVLVAAVVVVGAGIVGTTVSYVMDGESVHDNYLAAVALDIGVSQSGVQFELRDGRLTGDGQDDGTITVEVFEEPGSVAGRAALAVDITGGNAALCDALAVETTQPVVYDGSLPALTVANASLPSTLDLQVRLPNQAAFIAGDSCFVDLVFTAWHFDEETDQGYYDEERVPLSFTVVADVLPVQATMSTPFPFATSDSDDTDADVIETVDDERQGAVEPSEEVVSDESAVKDVEADLDEGAPENKTSEPEQETTDVSESKPAGDEDAQSAQERGEDEFAPIDAEEIAL